MTAVTLVAATESLLAELVAAGIPAVVFGPGGGGIHATTEWVDRASLRTFVAVLASFVTTWCAR
jgi:acetylornithine deacetylase